MDGLAGATLSVICLRLGRIPQIQWQRLDITKIVLAGTLNFNSNKQTEQRKKIKSELLQ